MTFRVGQKVVCIKRGPWKLDKMHHLKHGDILNVRSKYVGTDGRTYLLFIDIINAPQLLATGFREPGYWSGRFRPLVELKDDIAMFQALCPGLPVVPPAVVPPRAPAHQT